MYSQEHNFSEPLPGMWRCESQKDFQQNMSEICALLKSKRGDTKKAPDIPYIETLNGVYEGENVLDEK